jgi:hypothetical protein
MNFGLKTLGQQAVCTKFNKSPLIKSSKEERRKRRKNKPVYFIAIFL